MDLTSNQNLDPQAVNLAKAIRQTESSGDYNAIGDQGTSKGAYQFHNDHFEKWATQFGLDPKDFSPTNQDKVAYAKIKTWKDQGYNADEISGLWNGAKMVNGRPVAIHPSYVEKVKKNFGSPANVSDGGLNQNPAPTNNVSGSGLNNYQPIANNSSDIPPNGSYANTKTDQPQGHGAAGILTGAATLTGMQPFGAGISTLLDSSPQKAVDKISAQESQGQQSIINKIHTEKDPNKKQHLIGFLKQQYGVDYKAPTAEQLNPTYALSNKAVLGSAAATAALALSGGSKPNPGMVNGEIARNAAVEGSTPLLAQGVSKVVNSVKSGIGATGVGGLIGKALKAYGVYEVVKHSPAKGLLKVLLDM